MDGGGGASGRSRSGERAWSPLLRSQEIGSAAAAAAEPAIDLAYQRGQAQALNLLRSSGERKQALERQVALLKEEVQQKEFELASRPTHRLVQQLRNEISQMEKHLYPEREA